MKDETFTPLFKWGVTTLVAISLVACGGGEPSPSSSSETSSSSSETNQSSTPSVSSVAVISSEPSQSSSSSVASDLELVVAINAGSNTAATLDGVEYQADKYSSGGLQNSTTDSITGGSGSTLYQTERYGTYSYKIPVLQGTYTITVHMAELYNDTAGARTFDLLVEDNVEINDLDLYAMVGHDGAYTYTIENVTVSDGTLDIAVDPSQDNGTLSGFAVYSADGGIDPNAPEPPETSWPVWENCNGYVGITYDDGPTNTDAWVSALNSAGLAPVTWFVQGNNTNSLPGDIPKLMTTGYIQNHSYDHQNMGSWSYDQAKNNLQRANDAITNAGAPAPTIFRPPYGSTGNGLRQAANDLGMIVLLWDVDSRDWDGAGAGSIASSAGQLQNGQVILMHQNQNASRQAIPQVVQALKNNGMCPGALDPATGRAVAPY